MVKGGYQIINLDNVEHKQNVGVVHDGIYSKIKGTQKPIMISGINIGGLDYHDCYVKPKDVNSKYEFEMYGYKVTIDSDDVVTFYFIQPGTGIKRFIFNNDFSSNPTFIVEPEVYNDFISSLTDLPFVVYYKYEARDKVTVITYSDPNDLSGGGIREGSNFSIRAQNGNEIFYS